MSNETSISPIYRKFTPTLAHLIILSVIVLPLAGCGADGQGGQVISSLSTPTNTHSGEGAQVDSHHAATGSPDGEDPTAASTEHETAEHETAEHATAHAAEDLDSAAGLAEPAEGEEDPAISVTSTPTGATARLTWDAYPDSNVAGYSVHYGKQSSGEPGSCSYEESKSVESPPAVITGLEPNTPYFFAISAYGGEVGESESSSSCSNEVLVVTPAAQG